MPTTSALAAALPLLLLPTAGVAAWRRGLRTAHERGVWRGCALAVGLAVAGNAIDVVLVATGVPGMVRGAVVVLVWALVFALVYGALLHWNRFPTALADPHDTLNGAGGVLASFATLELGLPHAFPVIETWPWWEELALTAPVAALLVLLCTALTLSRMSGLARDARLWWVAGCLAAALVAAVLRLALLPGTVGVDDEPFGRAAGLSAALVGGAVTVSAICLLVAARLRPRVNTPVAAQPSGSTRGAFAILVVALLQLVAVYWVGDDDVPMLAAVGAAVVTALRLRNSSFDLAQLSSTLQLALTDELTGLANRRALLRALDARGADDTSSVLVLLDLDRFKEVNDGLGHDAGDELITAVGRRLRRHLDAGTLVARLGGDEYALVVDIPAGSDPALCTAALSARLAEAMHQPFVLASRVVPMSASAGLVPWMGPLPTGGALELLRRADAAMYEAKRGQRGSTVYDQDAHARATERLIVVGELRTALAEGGLVLHHQPQLRADDGELVGVESLVRWQHPTRGLLQPGAFLPQAEEHGLMGEVSAAVLVLAADQLAAWRRQGLELRASVNLSASDLLDRGLPARLAEMLHARGVPPCGLVLEVTESVVISEPDRSLAVLAELAELGVELSIDDYGTGYSSLAYLRRLPVHELKLDRSFTEDLLTDARARAVVASTVELAHVLSLRVVAEGVEDEEVHTQLAALGCDVVQGYLHSRPLPPQELLAWLRARGAPQAALPAQRAPGAVGRSRS